MADSNAPGVEDVPKETNSRDNPTDGNIPDEVNVPGTSRPNRKYKTTSYEDRERIIAANENGYSTTTITEMLSINKSTVYSILKKILESR